jgi:hypothetical protein
MDWEAVMRDEGIGDQGATSQTRSTAPWTMDAVVGLGTVTDVVTAGAILGIGRTKAYELARLDEFPVRVMRIGKRYVVPVSSVVQMLLRE